MRASSKVEIDPDAAENLMINMADFRYALDNDVKPAFGASQEILESYLSKGITVWGQPVKDVIEDGELLIRTAKNSAGTFLSACFWRALPMLEKQLWLPVLPWTVAFPLSRSALRMLWQGTPNPPSACKSGRSLTMPIGNVQFFVKKFVKLC